MIDTYGFTAEDFSFTLTSARPSIYAEACQSLSNFTASSTGSFSAAVAAVPEPGAWALMLVGFGGIGALMRRRTALAAICLTRRR